MDPLEGISQPDSACFIVYNSQEEESEMLSDPIQMLEKLPALRDPEMSDKRVSVCLDSMGQHRLIIHKTDFSF